MLDGSPTDALRAELAELRDRYEEATATLDAIRTGSVDALIVGGAEGDRVFTLDGADRPYRVLIEAMQQGAATLSVDGTILFCNHSLAVMLKTPQEKISGTPLSRFVSAADQAPLQTMLTEGQRSHSLGELSLIAGDATQLPVQLAMSALPLPGTTAIGLVVTDLTVEKQQEELVASHRRKDDFLAILAHELRNPLAPIRTAVQLLKMPGVSPAVAAQTRDIIERSVDTLTRLVDELLDVARISQGKIQLRKEPLELATIVNRAVEVARPLIEQKNHSLTLRLAPEPLWLEADPTRLEQIVVNLLNNAAKYTEANGKIDVSAGREDDCVVLRVKDTGIGIAPDVLPHIFELFTQADHSLDRTQGGLGIGLTLVRNLMELHGGKISGHSDGLGKGSEFTIRLPRLLKPPKSHRQTPATGSGANGCTLKIAVVDDNRDAGDSLGMLLRFYGHQVNVFRSGKTVLEAIASLRPDAVLLDIGLPDMDGYQVARQVRLQQEGEKVFLVAVTGYGQEDDRRRAAAAGFSHHLVKPVDPAELQALLLKHARHAANAAPA